MLRHIRHKSDVGINTINQLIDEINAARNIHVSGGMRMSKSKNGTVLSGGGMVMGGGGGMTIVWAEVDRSPLDANPAGDPEEGYGDYVLYLTSDTEKTTPINPQHFDYGEVDWRHFVPRYVAASIVPLISKDGVHYFWQQMTRVRESAGNQLQSVMWSEVQNRMMAVFTGLEEEEE